MSPVMTEICSSFYCKAKVTSEQTDV